MGRKIDMTVPYEDMSRDDLEYLSARGQLPGQVEKALLGADLVRDPDEVMSSDANRNDTGDINSAEIFARGRGTDLRADDADGGDVRDGSLESMTKAELLAEAERRGVEVRTSATKAEILEAIEEFEAE